MYEQNQYQWLRSIGKPLQEFYIFDWALNKEQAISLLNLFKYFRIPVYGGNVYKFENDIPKRTGDNWSVPYGTDFSNDEEVKNSLLNAKAYIETYENRNPGSFYTLITPTKPHNLSFEEMQERQKREVTLSDKIEFLVTLFEPFLKKEDAEVVRELNMTDNPLALEVFTMILIDCQIAVPKRIFDELKPMFSEANLDMKIIEGLSINSNVS